MFIKAKAGEGNTVEYSDVTEAIWIYSGGTRAWRNNNPGNIRSGEFATNHGAIGAAGGFAVFPDYETGKSALQSLLKTSFYQELSISDAITRYAPPVENNTANYQATLKKLTGLPLEKKMNALTDEELGKIVGAIQHIEGYHEGMVTRKIEPGKKESLPSVDIGTLR